MSLRSCLAFLVLGLPFPTHAAIVTWVFEGTVEGPFSTEPGGEPVEVPELTSLGVAAGTPFVATLSIDLDAPDSDSAPDWGQYDGAVLGVTFTAAAYSIALSGPSAWSYAFVHTASQTSQASYGGTLPRSFLASPGLSLVMEGQETTDAFATEALPDPFPSLDTLEPFQHTLNPDLNYGYGSFIVLEGGGPGYLFGSLTRQYTVPEPLAATCVGAGLLALVALRRRATS